MIDDQRNRTANSGTTEYVSPGEPTPAVDGTHGTTPAEWSDAAVGRTDAGDLRSESALPGTVETGETRDMSVSAGGPPEPTHPAAQIASRALILTLGIIGAVVAGIVATLYSLLHVLGRITGITDNSSHFFIGLALAVAGLIGAFTAIGSPSVGAALLAVAGIGLFFVVGWWALLAAPFLLAAAFLAYRNRDTV
jgi:hypothetical protein